MGEKVNFNDSGLAKLDVSKGRDITELYVQNNRLEKIDLSNNRKIKIFDCTGNPLKYIRGFAPAAAEHAARSTADLAAALDTDPAADSATGSTAASATGSTADSATGSAADSAAGSAMAPTTPVFPADIADSYPDIDETELLMRQFKAREDEVISSELLSIEAGRGGSVGLKYSPEEGQQYFAYPDEGYSFGGWYNALGDRLSKDAVWRDDYGTGREIIAMFFKA